MVLYDALQLSAGMDITNDEGFKDILRQRSFSEPLSMSERGDPAARRARALACSEVCNDELDWL